MNIHLYLEIDFYNLFNFQIQFELIRWQWHQNKAEKQKKAQVFICGLHF